MGKRAGIAVAGFAIVLALLSIACGDSRQGPSGLFRLAGVITESGLPTVPVTQALVGVSGTSVATTTSADGTFALDGLPADVEIQISKDQFEPSVMSVHLDGPREIRVQFAPDWRSAELRGHLHDDDWRWKLPIATLWPGPADLHGHAEC